MKKWQLGLVVVGLLVVVYGMNLVSGIQRDRAQAEAKKAEKARRDAMAQAQVGQPTSGPGAHQGDLGKQAFDLPASLGPKGAPVHLEVFVNGTNACHLVNVTFIERFQRVYGKLLRVDWFDMKDPKVAERADRLKIGCEAGITINGQIEMKIDRLGGPRIIGFRGPTGSGDWAKEDLYAAVNLALRQKGLQPSETARKLSNQPARARGM